MTIVDLITTFRRVLDDQDTLFQRSAQFIRSKTASDKKLLSNLLNEKSVLLKVLPWLLLDLQDRQAYPSLC